MIKVFVKGRKVNFVDDKNRLIGFDNEDDCCAHGGWFISLVKITEKLSKHDQDAPREYPAYSFDTDFFEEIETDDVDDGGLVLFKLVADGHPDLFLHLYNCHNGYYGRGFESTFGRSGDL